MLIQPGKIARPVSSNTLNFDPMEGPVQKTESFTKNISIKLPGTQQLIDSNKKSSTTKSTHENLVNARLQTEIDMLSSQLDLVQREKDMQRMEISRLRNQLLKLSGLPNASNEINFPTVEEYFLSQNSVSESKSIDSKNSPIDFDKASFSNGRISSPKMKKSN